MKKNRFVLVVFLLVGLLAGSIIAHLFSSIAYLEFFTKSAEFFWEPKADLGFLKYDLKFQVKLSLLSILGLALAFWLYRKI